MSVNASRRSIFSQPSLAAGARRRAARDGARDRRAGGRRAGPRAARLRRRLALSGRRHRAPPSRRPQGARRRREAQKHKPRGPVLHGQPGPRAARLRSDAAQLLHARLRALQGRTVLLPVAVLAGAGGDRQHVQRHRDQEDLRCARFARELQRAPGRPALLLDTNNSGAPEGTSRARWPPSTAPSRRPTGPGGAKYYDDNDWVGIELVRIYELTRDPAVLGARRGDHGLRDGRLAATDPTLALPRRHPVLEPAKTPIATRSRPRPPPSSRCSSTASPRNPQYLQFAEQAYDWVRTCLLLPSDLYADHIRPARRRRTAPLELHQGVMIGAGTLLYQATGNSDYLYQARQTAAAALAYFTPRTPRRREPVLPVGLLPQPALPGLGHARPAGAEASRRPTSTTPGSTCA